MSEHMTPPIETTEAARLCAERGLAKRQWEIAQELLTGATNEEIAERLYIEPSSVKAHMTAINRKLGTRGRHQIVCLLLGTMAATERGR
jgi:DNA-binding NarL/FixJ family response regulator